MSVAPETKWIEPVRWTTLLTWWIAIVLMFVLSGYDNFEISLVVAVGLGLLGCIVFGVVRYRPLGRRGLVRWAVSFFAGLALCVLIFVVVAWDLFDLFKPPARESFPTNQVAVAFGAIFSICFCLPLILGWQRVRSFVAGALLPSVAVISAGAIGMVVAGPVRYWLLSSACETAFESTAWIADISPHEGPTSRQCMVNDLVDRRLLIGLDRVQVASLLGQPTEAMVDGQLVYGLGRTYDGSIDLDFLMITFGPDGRVLEVEVIVT